MRQSLQNGKFCLAYFGDMIYDNNSNSYRKISIISMAGHRHLFKVPYMKFHFI